MEQLETTNRLRARASALKWALVYVSAAGFWIAVSSGVLLALLPQATPEQLSRLEIYKGLLFVGVTAVGLYVLLYRRLSAWVLSQEALRRSESRYRQLVETTDEGVWVFDAHGNTTFVNNKMASVLGYTAQSMLGMPLQRFFDADNAKIMAADLESSRQGCRLQRDLCLRHQDGSARWMIVSSTPMIDEQGVCSGVLATLTDITARKRAEGLLAEAEAKYRALVEESLVGVYVIQDGRFAYVNRRFAEIFGYVPPEIIQSLAVVDMMAPESRDLVVENLRKRLEGEVHSVHYTFTALGKDGTKVEAEVLGSIAMYHGRPAVIGSLLDITQRKQAEQALQRSERRFRQVVEHADALFLHDMAGQIVDVNQQACDSLGFSREELLRLSIFDIGHEFGGVDYTRVWAQVLAQGPLTLQGTHRRKDGVSFPVEVRLAAFDSGEQSLILALARDISDRRRAEQALRQSEERFRGIYRESPIGIVLYDATGRMIDANPACLDLFGIPSASAVRGFELFSDPCLPPHIGETVRRGEQGEFEVAYDFELIRQQGVYPTSRVGTADMHVLITPLCLEEPGRLNGYLIHIEDISKRKHAERALLFTQFAVDHAADAVFWLNVDNHFVYVNDAACRQLGYTREELLAMRVYDIDPDFLPEDWPDWHRRLKQERFFGFESRHRRKDGFIVPVEVTVNYLEFNNTEYTCAFVRNIAERRRLEEELRQSQKMEAVGRLAGGVAHDFNNLLAVISGYSESLLRHLDPDSSLCTNAMEIGKAADRGASLTRQLLAFSRRQVVKPQLLDLNQILRNLQEMLRRSIGKAIAIDIRFGDCLWKIKGDSGQMEQVVVNLVLNARDAMGQDGTLTIRTENFVITRDEHAPCKLQPGCYVRLTVQDTGCGMAPEVQMRIFEPFFTTKEGKGTGLGLSIVYGIIQQAGGCICVRSESNQGTTFDILLPRANHEAADEGRWIPGGEPAEERSPR